MSGYLKIKIEGTTMTGWFNGDESDSFVITGPAPTLDALARVLRGAGDHALEHELTQRGANREPVVNDMTTAEIAAASRR